MKIHNAVALVTGANRGIGLAFTRELLARGARKVYGGARDPASVTLPGVEPLRLDVTRADEIAAAVARAGDVTLVINNAGIGAVGGFLALDSEEVARRMFETNFFGVLRISQAFAPALKENGGGALLNVLSIASWLNGGLLAGYSASKAAAWSLTNSLRHELAAQKTQVTALHMAFVDTDLVREIDQPKASADEIVRRALDGLEAGLDEVIADERTRGVKQGLSAASPSYLPQRVDLSHGDPR
ncbi:MAG TPA: SDR family oxidoreductase [Burkholderiaceae bacterium]|nr:SDR family oxidoreductase [Burkholderiaceae bacterium]